MEKLVYQEHFKCLLIDSNERNFVYVSFHFGAGFGDRLVSENANVSWVGNGSANILMGIKKRKIQTQLPNVDVQTFVTMDTSTLAVKMKVEDYEEAMRVIIPAIFSETMTEEEFETERNRVAEIYESNLLKTDYRAMMEIMLYAMPNRLFSPLMLRDDLSQVEYSDINKLNDTLFQLNNALTIICADLEHADIKNWFETNDSVVTEPPSHGVKHVYRTTHDLADRHVVVQGVPDQFEIGSILFRRKKSNFSLEEEELFLRVIGEVVFRHDYFVNVSLDQSHIIYIGNQFVNYKNRIRITVWNEEKFNEAKEKVRSSFSTLRDNDAEQFSILFGQFAIKNINLYEVLRLTEALNFDRFIDYIRTIKEKMVETKLTFTNGGKPADE